MAKHKFELGDPQEDKPRGGRKKHRRWPLIVGGILVVLIICLFIFLDAGKIDNLKRKIIYAKAETDKNGCMELYSYTSDQSSVFETVGNSLINAEQHQLMLIGEDGKLLVNENVNFSQPAIAEGGSASAVYDIGGRDVFVLNEDGIVWKMESEGPILDLTMNGQDYVTIVCNKSGYKSAVIVYDNKGEAVMEHDSSDRFLMTAALSKDNKVLAVVKMGQESGKFTSYVSLYKTSTGSEIEVVPVKSSLVYQIGWVDNAFCVVGENGLFFISSNGEVLSEYSYSSNYLRRCILSENGYATVLLSHYKTGTQGYLITVDSKGNEVGGVDIDEDVLSLSVNGRYIGVLFSDNLAIYDKNLMISSRLNNISEARYVMMRPDGAAVLVGSIVARLYLP